MIVATSTEHFTSIAPDISCGQCVSKVRDALLQLDGIVHVQASAETHMVDVDFEPSRVSTAKIEQTLADAGYPVQQ